MEIELETLRVGDNFVYVLLDGLRAAVIDPGAAAPVEQLLAERGARSELILVTHHHGDHTGGCVALRNAAAGDCRLVGPKGGGLDLDQCVGDGDTVRFGDVTIATLAVPGHTRHDVAYHIPEMPAVFTGDVLFACGCGRMFLGNPEAMWASLQRLRALPAETRVCGGHDYLQENLLFAASLEPRNAELQKRLQQFRRRNGGSWKPSTIAEECRTNPFLRCDTATLRDAVNMPDAPAPAILAEIRTRKDRW